VSEYLIGHVPLWAMVIVALGGLPAATVLIQILLRRAFPHLRGDQHNEVTGFLLAVIGVGYAVIAGLMIVTLWQGFADASAGSVNEANKLLDLVANSETLGKASNDEIRTLAITYVHRVAEHEWNSMTHGAEDPGVSAALQGMGTALGQVSTTGAANAALSVCLNDLNALRDAREKRLRNAQDNIPGTLWLALIVSGAITLGFCLLFGGLGPRLHHLMVAGVTAIIAVGLLQIILLDHPYSGEVAVRPTAFVHALDELAPPTTE
jgi:hypothetical protein